MVEPSTHEKGTSFERAVFELLDTQIRNGDFLAPTECCRLYWQKGYYSKERESNIVFDISVEVMFPGDEDLTLLILVECKNYQRLVGVGEVEEFWSKLSQVSGSKGIVFCPNGYQEGAIQFAKSNRIGLVRYCPENADSLKYVLRRSPSSALRNEHGLPSSVIREVMLGGVTDRFDLFTYFEGSVSCAANFFYSALCFSDQRELSSVQMALLSRRSSSRPFTVPYLHKSEIEGIAERELDRLGYVGEGQVDLESICARLHESSGLVVEVLPAAEKQQALLGQIEFDSKKISIYLQPSRNVGRERFTLAHEIGHLLLGHDRFLRREYTESDDFIPASVQQIKDKDVQRLEIQANYFASCFLLPADPFLREFAKVANHYQIRDRGFGLLYVDDQPSTQKAYFWITNRLKTVFAVSRTAIDRRLKSFGILNDQRSVPKKSEALIGSLIS